MKSLTLVVAAVALLSSGTSFGQTTSGSGAGTGSSTALPGMSGSTSSTGNTTGSAGMPGATNTRNGDTTAASGDTNQTVATTSANSPTPAKGANSFTMGEAQDRLERNGFSGVSDLAKDGDGIWRGKAQKGGRTTAVWLDYKGNVGESQ